ncbi:MAG: hypothetical protein O2868_15930, partial [Proteobacteria bacterium]|nr:hypothetical protein [Pseudomonadota bacterium]
EEVRDLIEGLDLLDIHDDVHPTIMDKNQRFRLISYWNHGPSSRLISYWKRLALPHLHHLWYPANLLRSGQEGDQSGFPRSRQTCLHQSAPRTAPQSGNMA